ncbi:MAG: hypothetical protein ACTS22_10255 [Phycisphaerales bacterium]
MTEAAAHTPGRPVPRCWLAPIIVVAIAWGLQAVTLGAGFQPAGPAAYDEARFHRPTIAAFADELPAPDLRDYAVATAPGHHLVLAVIERLADPGDALLRAASGQTTVLLLALSAAWIARRAGNAWGIAGALALLGSSYIAPQLILTLPEGSAWLLVAVLLGVGLSARRSSLAAVILAAVLATLLVSIRQLHLWTVVIAWMIAWLGPEPDPSPTRLVPRASELDLAARLPRAFAAGLATLPAFAVVAALFVLWQGPVPPGFQVGRTELEGANSHNGLNPATVALFFAAAGTTLPLLLTPSLDALARRPELRRAALRLALLGAALGLLAAVLVPTGFDKAAGRWSGLWNAARAFPTIADRSVFIASLAALGGAGLGLGLATITPRDRLILLGALAAYLAAQSANLQAWMRYVEPMAILVGLALAAQTARRFGTPRPWTLAGPLLLAAALGGRTALALLG